MYSLLPERIRGRVDGDGGEQKSRHDIMKKGKYSSRMKEDEGGWGADLKSYEEKKNKTNWQFLNSQEKNVYTIKEIDVIFKNLS